MKKKDSAKNDEDSSTNKSFMVAKVEEGAPYQTGGTDWA